MHNLHAQMQTVALLMRSGLHKSAAQMHSQCTRRDSGAMPDAVVP